MRNTRGFSLLELIVAIGLSLIVLSASYGAYSGISRADDVERHRERITIAANSAMSRIQQDIRRASSVRASGTTMVAQTSSGTIVYRAVASGLERRVGASRSVVNSLAASFRQSGRGVDVSVWAREEVHRRAVRVDLNCFVTPRNS